MADGGFKNLVPLARVYLVLFIDGYDSVIVHNLFDCPFVLAIQIDV